MEPSMIPVGRSPLPRLLFRFALIYWFLFIVPLPPLWLAIVPWAGRHLFHVHATVRYWFQAFLGAGDSMFHYVQVFCALSLAAIVAIVWTVLQRRPGDDARLHAWLRLVLRFYLAAAMLVYGGGKLIPDQFPAPPLDTLVRNVGELSRVELLWTFMGASPAYTIFTGIAEMAGGLLLTARRTTFLGALICAGVMANVFMLNVGYDVPVKILSLHLLVMSLFLAAPDIVRLTDFLLFRRPAQLSAPQLLFVKPWLNRAGFVLRTVLVLIVTGLSVFVSWYHQRYYGDWAPRPPLYGIWDVVEFRIDGQLKPPLLSDRMRWRRVIFPEQGVCSIQLMDDQLRRYRSNLDEATRSITLTRYTNPAWKAHLVYQQPRPEDLILEGTFDAHALRLTLHQHDLSTLPLAGGRFHWVHEPSFEP